MPFTTFKSNKQKRRFHCVYGIWTQIHWEEIGIGRYGKKWLNLVYLVHKTNKTFNEYEL